MTIEDIMTALKGADQVELLNIRRYIQWIKIRRRVHQYFYLRAHWVRGNHGG